MRIALCFHGLSRGKHTVLIKKNTRDFSPSLNLDGIQDLCRNLNNQVVDIFIHTWNPKSKKQLIKDYQPRCIVAEKVTSQVHRKVLNLDQNPKNQIILDHFNQPGYSRVYAIYSNYYSLKTVNQLRKEVEESSGFQYDLVIHTRFDIYFRGLMDFSGFAGNLLYISSKPRHFHHKKFIYDYFFFSNGELADKLCNCYDHLPKIIDKMIDLENLPPTDGIYGFNNHRLLGVYFKIARMYRCSQKILDSPNLSVCKIEKHQIAHDPEAMKLRIDFKLHSFSF